MERDEFLKSLGLGLALVCTGSCFQSCSKGGNEEEQPSTGNNNTGNSNTVSVDITNLASVGSKTTVNGVLFMRIATGDALSSFLATAPVCTHEGGQLNWVSANNRIRCSTHGAEFSTTGAVLTGPASTALKVYATALSGTTLTATKS